MTGGGLAILPVCSQGRRRRRRTERGREGEAQGGAGGGVKGGMSFLRVTFSHAKRIVLAVRSGVTRREKRGSLCNVWCNAEGEREVV